MVISSTLPNTARRLRIKRLKTCRPGERTLTRETSSRWISASASFTWVAALAFKASFRYVLAIVPPPQLKRTRGSTTAYSRSEIRLPSSVRMEIKAR